MGSVASGINFGQVASIGLQAFSGAMQANSQVQSGKAQQQIHNFNASQLIKDAENQRIDAQSNALRIRREGKSLKGTQRALYAHQGVLTSEGSPLEVMAESAAQVEIEALNVERNAQIISMKRETEAAIQVAQGQDARSAGKRAGIATALGSASSIFQSARKFGFTTPGKIPTKAKKPATTVNPIYAPNSPVPQI